jgi:Holliday junction resolvase-like predicted endonuclease
VDRKKQKAYIRLANAYILRNNRIEEARFDIISIIINGSEPQVKHIVGAFTTIG